MSVTLPVWLETTPLAELLSADGATSATSFVATILPMFVTVVPLAPVAVRLSALPDWSVPLLFAVPGYLGVIASFLRREDDPRGRFRPLRSRTSWRRQLREGRFQKHLAVSTAISAVASGFEALYSHYKNNFKFKAQWTPVIVAPMLTAASVAAVFHRKAAHSWLPAMSVLATVNGLVGFGYHLRGLLRRPGGVHYLGYNLVYGPPIFAPLLFSASGFLGLLASLMRRER